MLNSLFPQHTPDLALPLFSSVVGLLEFLLFLIEPFEVVILCHNNLGSAIQLASEVRDLCFQSFNGFFAPFSLQPCPHGLGLPLFPSVILRQFPFFSPLSGVVSCVHLFPPVFLAVVVETMLPAREVSVGPSSLSLTRFCCGAQSSPGFASISCRQSLSWATLGFLDLLVNCGYQPDSCFAPRWI